MKSFKLGRFQRRAADSNSLPKRRAVIYQGLCHMYFNDWKNGMLPYKLNRSKDYKIQCNPNESTEVMSNLFNVNDYNSDIKDSFRDFVTELTQLVIMDGKAVFQLQKARSDRRGSKDFIALRSIDPITLDFQDGIVNQRLEKSDFHEEFEESCSIQHLFVFEEPDWIEGGLGFEAILEFLSSVDTEHQPILDHFSKTSRGETSYFNYESYRELTEVWKLKETRLGGWDFRQLHNDRITEFYWLIRHLRMKLEQAKFLEKIIRCVNNQLPLLLAKAGIQFRNIAISGVRTPKEVKNVISSVRKGEMGFTEALELD